MSTQLFDVFISHASEDKDDVARPLADALTKKGYKVWYDEFALKIGDSLRRSIDEGLAQSRFGIVILSPHFFEKEWPQRELDGLTARESTGDKIILPIYHNVTVEDVRNYSPMLADRIGVSSEKGIPRVVEELVKVLGELPGTSDVDDDAQTTDNWITIQTARKRFVVTEKTLLKYVKRGEIPVQEENTGTSETLLLKVESLDDKFLRRAIVPLLVGGAAAGLAASVVPSFISWLREQLRASEAESPSTLFERFDEKYVGETAKQQLERASGSYRATERERQAKTEPAKPLKVATNSIGMKAILTAAGEFLMGSLDSDKDGQPQHRVEITKPFYLGQFPLTQAEYRKVMGANPSKFKGNERRPVEQVSWLDAVKFCNRLSEREGLRKHYGFNGEEVRILGGNGYRLPTEAEWEYACRARTTTKWSFGDDESKLGEFAWYDENSNDTTHPVGRKKPNPWGLHDMHGNVWEWCGDWHDGDYYKVSPKKDPTGPSNGFLFFRVVRGGWYGSEAELLRSADRFFFIPSNRSDAVGFRVARNCE